MGTIISLCNFKMRVLILSAALFACASGAPSGDLAPVPTSVPAEIVKAEEVDPTVQDQKYLQAVIEKQRLEVNPEKLLEGKDQAKEKSLEAYWAGEEKKWQALDAKKVAEAQVDGQLAQVDGQLAQAEDNTNIKSPVVSPVSLAQNPPIGFPAFVAPIINTATHFVETFTGPIQGANQNTYVNKPDDQRIKPESPSFGIPSFIPPVVNTATHFVETFTGPIQAGDQTASINKPDGQRIKPETPAYGFPSFITPAVNTAAHFVETFTGPIQAGNQNTNVKNLDGHKTEPASSNILSVNTPVENTPEQLAISDTIDTRTAKNIAEENRESVYVVSTNAGDAIISHEGKYVIQPFLAPVAISPFKFASPFALIQPGIKTIPSVPYGHVLAPTVYKTVW